MYFSNLRVFAQAISEDTDLDDIREIIRCITEKEWFMKKSKKDHTAVVIREINETVIIAFVGHPDMAALDTPARKGVVNVFDQNLNLIQDITVPSWMRSSPMLICYLSSEERLLHSQDAVNILTTAFDKLLQQIASRDMEFCGKIAKGAIKQNFSLRLQFANFLVVRYNFGEMFLSEAANRCVAGNSLYYRAEEGLSVVYKSKVTMLLVDQGVSDLLERMGRFRNIPLIEFDQDHVDDEKDHKKAIKEWKEEMQHEKVKQLQFDEWTLDNGMLSFTFEIRP